MRRVISRRWRVWSLISLLSFCCWICPWSLAALSKPKLVMAGLHWQSFTVPVKKRERGKLVRLLHAYAYSALYRLSEHRCLLLLSNVKPPRLEAADAGQFMGDQSWLAGLSLYRGVWRFSHEVPMSLLYGLPFADEQVPSQYPDKRWWQLQQWALVGDMQQIQHASALVFNGLWQHLTAAQRGYVLALAMVSYLREQRASAALLLWDRYAQQIYGPKPVPLMMFLLRRLALLRLAKASS